MKIDNAYLQRLYDLGGYYDCPKGPEGRLGPLVGYAGKDDLGRQFVGDAYANFANIERDGFSLDLVAHHLSVEVEKECSSILYGFCGAPEGGKALATVMATKTQRHDRPRSYIYPEKKITQLATSDLREQSKLVFGRHEPVAGRGYVIVEDVCNNFSTTRELVELINSYGANVLAIACFLNRSLTVNKVFDCGGEIPVIALVRKPIAEYRQDDPEVALDVSSGNVVLKPKNDWARLQRAMADS